MSNAVAAVTQGLLVAAGLVAASFGINYQFANRPTAMWLIDRGYHTVQFTIYGAILGCGASARPAMRPNIEPLTGLEQRTELEADANADDQGMVSRLIREWREGRNRFSAGAKGSTLPNEASGCAASAA